MANSSSKRRKAVEKEEEMEDRISTLTDDVLTHILSFLPTRISVTTSILSSRWRHIWQHLLVLDFDDDFNVEGFPILVNGVLNLLHNPRGIRKMTLQCFHTFSRDKFREYSVNNWVLTVIGPHLQELNLLLTNHNGNEYGDEDEGSDFKLPQTLFTSPNLVSLSLVGEITLQKLSSTTVSLPSLKRMAINIGLEEVAYVNELLCGCSIIETLDLCFLPQSLDKVCVPSSLKRLKIAIENDVGAYLQINAPDLEYLNITKITFGDVFSMYNLHNVVEAYLDVFPQSGSVTPLHNLLGALSGTKHLVLSQSTTKWLFVAPHDLLFQEFLYLIRLELNLPWFNSNSLLSLLQKCPMLQVLLIQHDKEQSPTLRWNPQLGVPNCLVSHLSFVEYKGFRGFPDELSFVKYVLRNGYVLSTMIIAHISLYPKKKKSIVKLLSDVPKASRMCQLKFD